jgi:3-oxoadipate enol-lactonase
MFVRYQAGSQGSLTVLLLHGWMASSDLNWLGTFQALAGRYHVLAVDHRGHGRGIRTVEPFTLEDCADDAAGLLRELGVRNAVVAGYSMGGPIALLLARRHPDLVRGLVLAATSGELSRTGLRRAMSAYVRLLGPLVRSGVPDRVIAQVARMRPSILGDLAELTPWVAGEMKRLHPDDVVGAGRSIAAFDARPWIGRLDTPAASVVTLHDRAVPPRRQRLTAAALGATTIDVEGGHAVCATRPDLFAAAMRQAVDAVAGRGERRFGRASRRLARGTRQVTQLGLPAGEVVDVAV